MKQRTLLSLVLTFLMTMLTISSCKKDADFQAIDSNKTEVADKIKTVSVGSDGIATITTVNGSSYTQNVAIKSSKGNLFTSSISSNGDSTVVFKLPIPILSSKLGGAHSNYVLPPGSGFQPILATVRSVNGVVSVSLSSYSQYSNGTTQNVTVFGITSYGDGGAFFVQYERYGVGGFESFTIEYFFHFAA